MIMLSTLGILLAIILGYNCAGNLYEGDYLFAFGNGVTSIILFSLAAFTLDKTK